MAPTYSAAPKLGSIAPDFSLQGVDGKIYSLRDFSNAKALTIVFMCNHCPYVVAVQDRIEALARKFRPRGAVLVGINSNDAVRYPDDSFEAMKVRAKEVGYSFPYLVDESQSVARAYGAVCTPDPYLFENVGGVFKLRYQGRIDDSWKEPAQVSETSLANAIEAVLDGSPISESQPPSMGCSIKWKQPSA